MSTNLSSVSDGAGKASSSEGCFLCPRHCGRLRTESSPGLCHAREGHGRFRLGAVMLHKWEEPYISGPEPGGAGNLFFSGCSLGCCFCQNRSISLEGAGRIFTEEELYCAAQDLLEQGAHTLSFVTAEHYADELLPLLKRLKRESFPLPLVWNSGGFQTVDSLRRLEGLIDVYLPDVKFFDSAVSSSLARAPRYFSLAMEGLAEMLRQQPVNRFNEAGVMTCGVALRHLILPGLSGDSLRLLETLAEEKRLLTRPLALMAQYTPEFFDAESPRDAYTKQLHRRLTTFEYRRVVDKALELGFTSLLGQGREAATSKYTPCFWGNSDQKDGYDK